MQFGRILLFALSLGYLAAPAPAFAISIDLGGVRLPLPVIVPEQPYRRDYGTSTRSQPRWHVVIDEGRRFATNDQGVWVGHDEAGNMVMQIQIAQPMGDPKTAVAVQVDVNGRYFSTVPATIANDHLVVVQGADVESILGRLMSGSRLRITLGPNVIDTHLRGSRAAIDEVRAGALFQRRLYAEGKVETRKNADAEAEKKDENAIAFYLPGVRGAGTAEVRFDIIEGSGLVLYAKFSQIPGHGDPEYAIPYTHIEAERVIRLIRKAQEWTDIAVKNRVGLYSKRIGFVDEANAAPDEGDAEEDATQEGSGENAAGDMQESARAGTPSPEEEADAAPEAGAPIQEGDPKNFKAVNFNSYEDGSTSVQLEHAVQGFSRRFNLPLPEALKLADSLANTLKYATFRLEKRDFDMQEKDKLFK
ncbi:MAG: hypothetical protein KDJ90_07095 [Nitratireductor sp.]|nr:hypothetical protein [Nitratireductor sp.]